VSGSASAAPTCWAMMVKLTASCGTANESRLDGKPVRTVVVAMGTSSTVRLPTGGGSVHPMKDGSVGPGSEIVAHRSPAMQSLASSQTSVHSPSMHVSDSHSAPVVQAAALKLPMLLAVTHAVPTRSVVPSPSASSGKGAQTKPAPHVVVSEHGSAHVPPSAAGRQSVVSQSMERVHGSPTAMTRPPSGGRAMQRDAAQRRPAPQSSSTAHSGPTHRPLMHEPPAVPHSPAELHAGRQTPSQHW